jgi:hypothetical protein
MLLGCIDGNGRAEAAATGSCGVARKEMVFVPCKSMLSPTLAVSRTRVFAEDRQAPFSTMHVPILKKRDIID